MFREALHNALPMSLGLVSFAEIREIKWKLVELFYTCVWKGYCNVCRPFTVA